MPPRRSARRAKRPRSPSPPARRRGGTPVAALAAPAAVPGALKSVSLARTAGPALAAVTATGAFVPADFQRAAAAALTALRSAAGAARPLDAAAVLADAGVALPPPPPPRASRAPPPPSETHAVARGPGGGRPLAAGRDVLVTIAMSDAGKPTKPALEAVFVADGELTWAHVAAAVPCPTPAALARLGARGTGAYVAVEGRILVDAAAAAAGGADYGGPLVSFLSSAGAAPPAPPRRPAPEAGPLRGRPPADGNAAAWTIGDWAAARLADAPLRCGGGGGAVFGHCGACEHALAVRDVRLATAADAAGGALTGDFPVVVARAPVARGRRCGVCRGARAARAVWACADAPGDPSFWCLPCYETFFYDANRELARDHRVVVYEGG